MKRKTEKAFPVYSIICLFVYIVTNLFAFNVSRVINCNFYHYDMTTSADNLIPFLPIFATFYLFAFIQWGGTLLLTSFTGKDLCYKYTVAQFIACAITMIIFIAFPTQMVRPDITDNGIFDKCAQLIYAADEPTNLFPSMHCIESYLCIRLTMEMTDRIKKILLPFNIIFSILVFASTLFVKQHVIVDVVSGIIVAEAAYQITKRLKLQRILYRIEKKFRKAETTNK